MSFSLIRQTLKDQIFENKSTLDDFLKKNHQLSVTTNAKLQPGNLTLSTELHLETGELYKY